jgi:hypothetical protein
MIVTQWSNEWDLWNLSLTHKVVFDGEARLIIITPPTTTLDVKEDLYSSWKEWMLVRDNSKFIAAFEAVGGQDLPGSQVLGSTYFLINGWRIRPYEADINLTVIGNLYTREGDSPFVKTLGSWNTNINSTISTLVLDVIVPSPALGLTPAQESKLNSIPSETLTVEEHDHLMQLANGAVVISPEDLQVIIDGVWEKVLPNGVTAQDYMIYKLLSTNKFIGLK